MKYVKFYIKKMYISNFISNSHALHLPCFIRTGDCLLGIDDIDLLGLKVKDIATLIRSEESGYDINFSIWRYPHQKEEHDIGLALKGPLPDVARNLANALSGTVYVIYSLFFYSSFL